VTEYRVIEARKRSFVINAKLPEKSESPADLSIKYYLVNQDGAYLTNQNGDRLIWDTTVSGYPRIFPARKRSFVINAEVNYG